MSAVLQRGVFLFVMTLLLLFVPLSALAAPQVPVGFLHYPNEGGFAHFMAEDLYPTQGDYDFNDAVIAVHQVVSLNAEGQALGVMIHLKVIASGARHRNQIGFSLPVERKVVRAYMNQAQAHASIEESMILVPWATEELATYTLVPGTNDEFTGSELINTRPGEAIEEAVEYRFIFNFCAPQLIDTSQAPFDIFLFRERDDGDQLEVHLTPYPGTSLAHDFRGQYDDASTDTRHYVDKNGVPFAFMVPAATAYPQEGVAIDLLFPEIVSFGTSGGATNTDFYLAPEIAYEFVAPSGSAIPEGEFLGFSPGFQQSLPTADVCALGDERLIPWCLVMDELRELEELLPIESSVGWVESSSGLSFGYGVAPASFTDLRATAGDESMKIPASTRWLYSPSFNTADLARVGTQLEVDLYFPSNGQGWWSIEMLLRTPTGTATSLGQMNMSSMLPGAWNTLTFDLPAGVQEILLGDNPNYQFAFKTNSNYQANANHHLDYLRFAGVMTERTIMHQEGSLGIPVDTNELLNFEGTGDWTSSATLELVSSPVSDGDQALLVQTDGWTTVNSRSFSTTELPSVSGVMGIDIYVPQPTVNPWWQGTAELRVSCSTSGLSLVSIGGILVLENMFLDEFNHFEVVVPANIQAAFESDDTCTLQLQLNSSEVGGFVVDRIGFL
ncbi:MAG: LruC domain-containing protein [Polyangiaceae bacterium]|nr:LruC domain-containing protein [Polyangiaceae bacterium]